MLINQSKFSVIIGMKIEKIVNLIISLYKIIVRKGQKIWKTKIQQSKQSKN